MPPSTPVPSGSICTPRPMRSGQRVHRDRGQGFDLATVEEDRMGVRGSIVERTKRAGGTRDNQDGAGEGTEV